MKITVVQPTNIFVDLEKAIEERFGIRQAIVVDVGENASYSHGHYNEDCTLFIAEFFSVNLCIKAQKLFKLTVKKSVEP